MRPTAGRVTLVVATLGLLAVACGSGQKVGSEKLLNFQEQKDAEALGRAPNATEQPLTIGQTPAPTVAAPRPTQPPKATPVVFEIQLVTDSPFYKPGNCIAIVPGVSIHVVNKDTTPERKSGRSFTDKGGTFNSGMLKPGQSWTWNFTQAATYDIIDLGVNFASAVLHVGEGSCTK